MPSSAPPDFNLISPVYDALAQVLFGKAQQRAQAHFLSVIPPEAQVLILGGGSGLILTQLLQVCSPAKVLYLEASSEMLQKAKARFSRLSTSTKVEFRVGTQDSLLPSETFHVVMTPFVLDLFTPEQALEIMQKLNRALLPAGLWLHTDFHVSASPVQQLWQKPMLWSMYRFFQFVSGISGKTLPPFQKLFSRIGLQPLQEASFFGDFIKAQVLQKPATSSS